MLNTKAQTQCNFAAVFENGKIQCALEMGHTGPHVAPPMSKEEFAKIGEVQSYEERMIGALGEVSDEH